MPSKVAVELGAVQKTLLLPLWGRAVETRQPTPLLEDPAAVRIVDSIDFDFSTIAREMHELTMAAWVARSLVMDRLVCEFLARHPDGCVVNLGCGLDTTFDRVDNGKVRWFDLDLPDVIELRRRFIAETERRTFVAASLLDEGWLGSVPASRGIMFMASGVLYYFEEREVRAVLIRLADRFPGSEIAFDAASPRGVAISNKMVIRRGGMGEGALLKWGIDRTRDIEAWDPRLRVLGEIRYFRGTGVRPKKRFMAWLSDFLRIQYVVRLQLGQSEARAA
jgi:O-methyltransferase involved in polyketide biosynthesis